MKRKVKILCIVVGMLVLGQLFLVSAAAQEKITLRYLERMRVEEWGKGLYDHLAAMYEQMNPNVRIEYISISYANQRQQTLLRGQAGTIDISEPVVSWIPQLAEADVLTPIEQYLTKDELDQYIEASRMDGIYNGVAYGVPYMVGPIILYINKDLIPKAGYPLRGPRDILEFKEMIAKVASLGTTEEGGKIQGFALRSSKSANSALWFMPWIWQWGGDLVDIYGKANLDSIGFRRALEFYKWMGETGVTEAGMDPFKSRIAFAEGLAGFCHDGPWLSGMLRTISDNPDIDDMYIVSRMPKSWSGPPWSNGNSTSIVVIKKSKHKKEAFEFAKWFTTNESTFKDLYEIMGFIPPIKKMLTESPLFKTPFAKANIEQLPYTRSTPWKNPKWPGAQEILATALSDAIAGGDISRIQERAQSSLMELLED